MDANEYQKRAMTTLNPALGKKDVLINSVMGLCGESGEAIDIVKKWLAQGHALDKEHLAKELGDIAWYLAFAAAPYRIVKYKSWKKIYDEQLYHKWCTSHYPYDELHKIAEGFKL